MCLLHENDLTWLILSYSYKIWINPAVTWSIVLVVVYNASSPHGTCLMIGPLVVIFILLYLNACAALEGAHGLRLICTKLTVETLVKFLK